MTRTLNGTRVAFLATDGVEQLELTSPWRAIEAAGGTPVLVSPKRGRVHAMLGSDRRDTFIVDVEVRETDAAIFDALVIPGGVIGVDALRDDAASVHFVREFVDAGKPIAAIGCAPWVLIEAGATEGRLLTSSPSIRTDLLNAGAAWLDERVVVDRELVTSRRSDDLGAFTSRMVEVMAARRVHLQGA
jgi:protease I